jgi:hypothetical protein
VAGALVQCRIISSARAVPGAMFLVQPSFFLALPSAVVFVALTVAVRTSCPAAGAVFFPEQQGDVAILFTAFLPDERVQSVADALPPGGIVTLCRESGRPLIADELEIDMDLVSTVFR